jgi:hypothetical protein
MERLSWIMNKYGSLNKVSASVCESDEKKEKYGQDNGYYSLTVTEPQSYK